VRIEGISETTDADLVTEVVAGDAAAFAHLVRRHAPMAKRMAMFWGAGADRRAEARISGPCLVWERLTGSDAYLGNGLLTSGGQQWRQQRRMVAPLFSRRHIDGYVDVMAEEAARLANSWSTAAGQGASVDVNAAMVDYALRTVGRVLFGADVTDAVPVIRATFPILNQHVRRRGISPLQLPATVAYSESDPCSSRQTRAL
jgi:cytochrome P450